MIIRRRTVLVYGFELLFTLMLVITIAVYSSEILQFIQHNTSLFNLLFSAAVAVATWMYVRLTRALVDETRRLREAQTEPALSIFVEPSERALSLLDLIIENVGGGAARSVRLTVSPDFDVTQDHKLSQIGPFKNGIGHLSPGQRVRLFFTSMFESYDSKINTKLIITARYEGMSGLVFTGLFPIDLSELLAMSRIGDSPVFVIAKHVEQIDRTLHNLASGFQRINVNIHTVQDVAEADARWRKSRQGVATAPINHPDSTGIEVFATPHGGSYHRAGCRFLGQGRTRLPLSEAAKTLSPCKSCGAPATEGIVDSGTTDSAIDTKPPGYEQRTV